MSSLTLILFFASLSGIILMIGRKFIALKDQLELEKEEILFEVPYMSEAKHLTIRNIKAFVRRSAVASIKFYVKLSYFTRNKYQELKTFIKERLRDSRSRLENGQDQTVNKFLGVIGDYKHKIKKRIKEEEDKL